MELFDKDKFSDIWYDVVEKMYNDIPNMLDCNGVSPQLFDFLMDEENESVCLAQKYQV